MNLCQFGSGIMNNESLRKAQQNRYELIASKFQFFFRGNMPPDPPIIIIRASRLIVRLFLQ